MVSASVPSGSNQKVSAVERIHGWSAGLRGASWLVLVIGLACSLLAWQHAARGLREAAQVRLDEASEAAAARMREQIVRYIDVLSGFRGLFRASPDVSRRQFHEQYAELRLADKYPGLIAIQFSPVVPAHELAAFETRVRADRSVEPAGYPGFAVRPPGARAVYMPILYTEPMRSNEAAFGYDVLFRPMIRAVQERARDSGEVTASAPFELVQGGAEPIGFVVRQAIYVEGAPLGSVEQRRAAYRGQVSAVVRVADMMRQVAGSDFLLNYHLGVRDLGASSYRIGQPIEAPLDLFDSAQSIAERRLHAGLTDADRRLHVIEVAGRMWELSVSRPTPNALLMPYPLALLAGGLVATVALFGALRGLAMQYSRATDMAERMSRAARDSEARLKAVIDHTVDGIVTLDAQGLIRSANPATERIFGYGAAELAGQPLSHLIPTLTGTVHSGMLRRHVGSTSGSPSGPGREVRAVRRDGGGFPLDLALGEMLLDGQSWLVGVLRDLSQQRAAETAYQEAKRQLDRVDEMRRVIVHHAPYAILVIGHSGKVMAMNPASEELLGRRADDTIGRLTPQVFLDPLELTERTTQLSARLGRDLTPANMLARHASDADWAPSEWTIVRPDGSRLIAEVQVTPLRGDDGAVSSYLVMAHDVTDRRQAENQLQHLALHDALTGLPNRSWLLDQLKAALGHAQREGSTPALLFIDLDRFKKINDSLGHHVGDGVLVEVARRLRETLRTSDMVARLGGDEFVVLLPRVSQRGDVEDVAAKLLAHFREPLHVGPHELRVTPSIGVAVYPEHGSDADTLMRHADQAMYRVKTDGRNGVHTFSADMDRTTIDSLRLENDLYHALERRELLLHYQPQFDCASGRLTGAEALLRWMRGGEKLVSPAEFIPIAEETGLIVEIGAWVLGEACRQAQAWRTATGLDLHIGVNLSARQLDQLGVVEMVADALEATGLPPHALEVEITESVIVRESLRAAATLARLRSLGVRVAIDDFGVGYSSFAYLRELPVDRFKIDRSFLSAVPHSEADCRLTAALIAMAHRLEVGIVAEGVETEEQIRFLRQHGCDQAQGYHLGRPVAADKFAAVHLPAAHPQAAPNQA